MSSTHLASLSVVIPTKDRPDDLEVTINSVISQTVVPQQLIVIDQSVTDESQQRVAMLLTALRPETWRSLQLLYIRDVSLTGLTAARNRALTIVSTEIVLFLDDDVILENDFIEQILLVFRDNAKATGVSGVVTNYSPPPSAYRYWSRIFMRGPFWDDRQPVYWKAGRLGGGAPIRVTRLGGGLMGFRIAEIAGMAFDENLRGACPGEDVDFCVRLKPNAVLLITPNARLVHKQSPAGRSADYWLNKHAWTMWYLHYRNWNRGFCNMLCFAWLNVGYAFAATLASGRRLSLASWDGLLAAIHHSREFARTSSTLVVSADHRHCEP